MFDWLTHAVGSGSVAYLVVLAASGGDVIFPPVPSETVVITAGVLAAHGKLSVPLVVLLAMAGACAGDNVAYWLGRGVGDPIAVRVFRAEKSRRRLEWAEGAVRRHGGALVIAGRFIPGGRTATTFVAGTLEMEWRRFIVADLCAASLWAVYATGLGYVGGSAFQQSTWKPVVISLGLAVVITAGIEVWRRVQHSRGKDIVGDPL